MYFVVSLNFVVSRFSGMFKNNKKKTNKKKPDAYGHLFLCLFSDWVNSWTFWIIWQSKLVVPIKEALDMQVFSLKQHK